MFGHAIVGMGWQEGKAVGKTSTSGLVEPIMYVPKFGRGGLGASITIDLPTDPKGRKRILKPGQKRDEKKQLVAAAEADGRVRHYTKVGEALVEKKQLVYEVCAVIPLCVGQA
ncbi:hypothetical protein SARC_14556 [Sphaeroforma arctica JP610]|uniref:G-patch domain-containing protein n=1 Tax=Sphaeroforma arctica JP610 TaxID=667725 RepID=A0A0L0F9U0_9EUKA|nr:hypothetical protein SARC_14556 [Sphaeroforma arctica JP610]KNC72883.1 hypothetical protein SARC_14556 [Sphaeroforma arctica JP610]|eukprot:XP_014146785.1 hypothetical protein SARC_14556 [Sphaeroforma arctica JP610]